MPLHEAVWTSPIRPHSSPVARARREPPRRATPLDRGATVRVADDLSKGDRDRVPDGAEFVEADLTDPDDVAEAVTDDLDIVFHFAAYTDTNYDDDRELFEANTAMTYNVLERMHEVGVDRLAFTSSSTVYGEAPARRRRTTARLSPSLSTVPPSSPTRR